MKIRELLFVGFLMTCAVPAWAQETPPPAEPQVQQTPQKVENPPEPGSSGERLHWKDIPGNVIKDEKAIFTSPLHINRQNAKWWLLMGGGAAALIATDQKFTNRLPQHGGWSTASTWASRIGADYAIYPIWGTFYLAGKADSNPRARDTGRIGIEALIDADITVNVLKLVTQRPRPEVKGESVGFFKGGDAFPSGHSIKTWALARVAALEFKDSKLVPIIAYSSASLVSIARVGGRRHSPSDAFVGAAMGYFIGDYVYRKRHAPSEHSKVAWLANHVDFGLSVGR